MLIMSLSPDAPNWLKLSRISSVITPLTTFQLAIETYINQQHWQWHQQSATLAMASITGRPGCQTEPGNTGTKDF